MPAPEKEIRKNDLDVFSKTLTDMYSGADIEDVLGVEWILDGQGNPVEKEATPEKTFKKLYDMVCAQKSGSPIYFTNVLDKNSKKEKTYTLEVSENGIVPKQTNKELINAKHKAKALEELERINVELKKYKGDSPNILRLKNNCTSLVENLSGTSDKNEFCKQLNEFSKSAETFYSIYAPGNLNSKQSKNTSIAYSILKLRDDVAAGRMPFVPDKVEEIQARIASKYVNAYCQQTLRKDKSADNQKRAMAILSDPKLFKETVDKTLKDPAFMYMYGSRVPGDELDVLKRLNEGLSSKAVSVLKNVEKERSFPTKERQEIDAIRKQTPPKRVELHQRYESMSLEQQQPIAEAVKSLREELEAIGGDDNSSPEFAKLKHELLVADMRLQRGNSYMDVKQEMAGLGDAVDEYLSKKTQEGKLNSRGVKRSNVALRLRGLCDAVAQNKSPEMLVKSREEASKELLAERITMNIAKEMGKSKDPAIARQGVVLEKSKDAFEKAKEKLLKNETFSEMFNTEDKLQTALTKDPADVYEQIGVKQFEKEGPAPEKSVNKEKVEVNNEQVKVKDQHKDAVKEIEMQLI